MLPLHGWSSSDVSPHCRPAGSLGLAPDDAQRWAGAAGPAAPIRPLPATPQQLNASRPPVPSSDGLAARTATCPPVIYPRGIFDGTKAPAAIVHLTPRSLSLFLQLQGVSETRGSTVLLSLAVNQPHPPPGRTSRHHVSCWSCQFVASSPLLHPLPSRWEPFFHSASCRCPADSESPIFAVACHLGPFDIYHLLPSRLLRARSFDPTGSAGSM